MLQNGKIDCTRRAVRNLILHSSTRRRLSEAAVRFGSSMSSYVRRVRLSSSWRPDDGLLRSSSSWYLDDRLSSRSRGSRSLSSVTVREER